MTNSVTTQTSGVNAGVFEVVEATVDITRLGSAGAESFNPNSELSDIDDYAFVLVTDQEDDSLEVRFDAANDQFTARNLSDGAQVASTTDIGTVDIAVFKRR